MVCRALRNLSPHQLHLGPDPSLTLFLFPGKPSGFMPPQGLCTCSSLSGTLSLAVLKTAPYCLSFRSQLKVPSSDYAFGGREHSFTASCLFPFTVFSKSTIIIIVIIIIIIVAILSPHWTVSFLRAENLLTCSLLLPVSGVWCLVAIQ